MNEPSRVHGSWSPSELRLAWESIDRAGDEQSVEEDGTEEFLRFIASLPQATNTDASGSGDVTPWIASLSGVKLGRYVLRDFLGSGGFGVVFSAWDVDLERQVAIKIPRPDLFARYAVPTRFLDEARVAAMLSHPGIVPIHDVGKLGALVYIASELCDGLTLQDWMNLKSADRSPRVVARLIRELADAVGYAHSRGVIHQDLKPANVLTDRKPNHDDAGIPSRLRITDFGLSCRISTDGSVAPQVVGGTRRYMAPEQLENDAPIGTYTDVFSLGRILGELLTASQSKWSTPSSGEREAASVSNEPPNHSCPKHVPSELWYVYLRCVERDPAQRYQNGLALRDDLNRYLENLPVRARPVTISRVLLSWWYRRPLTFALVSILFLSIATGVTGTVVGLRRARVSLHSSTVAYGMLSSRSGNWQRSLQYFKDALTSGPHDTELALNYIDTLLSLQRYGEAAFEVRHAKSKVTSPDDARLLLIEGELGLVEGRSWEELEPLFQRAQSAARSESSDHALASAMLAPTTPEAIEWLRLAVSRDPYCHLAHVKLLAGLFFLGRYEEAEAECNSIRLLFPEDWTPTAYSAFIATGRGDTHEPAQYVAAMRAKFGTKELAGYEEELRAFRVLAELASNEEEWSVAAKLLEAVRESAPGLRSHADAGSPETVSVGFRRPVLPTVSRAWQHLGLAVRNLHHDTLPVACKELERAIALHPEGTLYQIHAAACIELNYANVEELLAKTVAATKSYQAAVEHTSLFPAMQPVARKLAVMGQFILGRPTRKVGPPDAEMCRLAIENVRALLEADELDVTHLRTFANYASQLSDHSLACDLALQWRTVAPNDQEAALFLCEQEVAAGRHEEALRRLRRTQWDDQYSERVQRLNTQCMDKLTELTQGQ